MISLCMIAKNEVEVLEKCILSVKKYLNKIVDDIVLVDTGSTDGTKELAEKLGCRVYDFEWVNDFSKARNFSVSKAKNDWVLVLDADEYIVKADKEELKNLCRKEYEHVLSNIMVASLDDNDDVFDRIRIHRIYNRKKFEFRESIHEAVYPIGNFTTAGYKTKITVEHTGYKRSTKIKRGKNEFYIKMLMDSLEKDSNNLYLVGHLATCYKEIKEFDKALECYERVVFDVASTDKSYYLMFVKEYLKLLIQIEQFNVGVICERLWEYCSHDDGYVYYMGIIFLYAGMNEKALECFLNCVNRTGETLMDKKHSYYQIGNILEHAGDFTNAIVCYKQCGSYENSEEKVEELSRRLKQ